MSLSPRSLSRPKNPTVSIIVPAKNEARNLLHVLPELPRVHEIIIVDGHSVDGTADAARQARPDARVINQTRSGKGNAVACGLNACTGDIVVMFDADGSADPGEIDRFVQVLRDGADFAKGSRYLSGGGSEDLTVIRSLGNKFLNNVTDVFFGTTYTDLCYGYNAFWRDLVPLLDLPDPHHQTSAGIMLWGDGFEIEAIINCRMAGADVVIVEVPSVERLRIHGSSNLNAMSDGIRVLRTLAAERWRLSRSRRRQRGTHGLSDTDPLIDGRAA